MEKKYQIFISSTYEDLKEERKKVQETILSMHHFPIGMEMFSAADEEQWEIIRENIDSSDYYVLIIGHRYGSVIERGEYAGISYTQKEFRYALEQKIPILAFLIDNSVAVTPEKMEQDADKKEKLKRFIEEVKSRRIVQWWTSKDDLACKVMISLNRQINQRKQVDFFVSNSHTDKQWAEWIVNCIEKEGYTTFWGERDLSIGDNFISIIQDYLEGAENFIAVLSPSYSASAYCQAEVSSVLLKGKKIIPIKVSEERPTGDIAKLLYVDIYNIDEKNAKEKLFNAISKDKKIITNDKIQEHIDVRFPGKLPENNLKFSGDGIIVGGENKIQAIRNAFSHSGMVSSNLTLSGKVGVGKTAIAKKYIQMYGYLYDLIWWIPAITTETVLSEYERFATVQKLIKSKVRSKKIIVKAVKQWMSNTKNWLFVFDNVEEYAAIQPFIPVDHGGNILILSRNSLLRDSKIDEIEVHELTIEEAKELLSIHGIDGNNEEINELIQTVGCLPAILEAAADYIIENRVSIKDFLHLTQSSSHNLDKPNYYSNLASVYKEQGLYDRALECYSMALEFDEEGTLNICTYFDMATIYQELGEVDKALELYNKILNFQQSSLLDVVLVAKIYNNMATIYLQLRRFDESEELFKKSLEHLRTELGDEHTSVATALNNIASVYTVSGKYNEALKYNQKALSIREKVLGSEHPDTATSYINIAENYLNLQNFSTALVYYEMGLNIYKNTLGDNNPNISYIYKSIGDIYKNLGAYKKSLEFYDRAVQIQQSAEYKNDDEVIYNRYNISGSDGSSIDAISLNERNELSDVLRPIEQKAQNILSELEEKDSEDFKLFNTYYSELISSVLFIQNKLVFNYDGKTEICHYSKIATLKHIIKQKDSEVQPKFRISNIAYLNDPSEGNVLLQMLKKEVNELNYNMLFGGVNEGEKLEQIPFSNVFIGSFSTAKNKLPMWTLYGDDSKGCCLVFDDYFFDEKNVLAEAKINEDKAERNSQDLTLYKVKYIDFDKLDKEGEKDVIIKTINEIAYKLNELEKVILKYESVRKWINDLLDMIRFLFKDFDYNYENEVRVIIHAEDAQIKLDDTLAVPRLFVEIQKKLGYKEIILGSKIEKPVEIAPFLLHSGMVKKVTKSGIHYQ